jgi:hypothetical protein
MTIRQHNVIPAHAGIHIGQERGAAGEMDSRVRGNDGVENAWGVPR